MNKPIIVTSNNIHKYSSVYSTIISTISAASSGVNILVWCKKELRMHLHLPYDTSDRAQHQAHIFNTCSHLHVSAEENILHLITHVQSGLVWSKFYTFSPVRSIWSGPKSIHNHMEHLYSRGQQHSKIVYKITWSYQDYTMITPSLHRDYTCL